MATISEQRPSPIAGLWYNNDPKALARQVDDYLRQARLPALEGEVLAVISPHAGHRYSGVTAGHAFKAVQGKSYDLVAIFSPLHAYHPARLLSSAHNSYATPLGPVKVNEPAVNQFEQNLQALADISLTRIAYDDEHSLEIELPFLQRALEGEFSLLPVMMRSQEPGVAHQAGLALAEVCRNRNALLVASTDLSHFYPEETANKLDEEMLHQFETFSPEGIFLAEHSGTGFACGMAAVAAVLWAARELGGNQVRILHHSTSADQTGDRSSVVGYGAAVVLKM